MKFDELNKVDLGYNGFTDFEAGASSRQAEINDALKQRDSFIKAHNIAMNDICNLKAEIDALKKRIDLIVDLVRDITPDYFLGNLIQDILKDGEQQRKRMISLKNTVWVKLWS